LRFHPCTTTEPRSLTLAQIEQFNRDGFLKGIRVFSAVEAEANRRYFDALLADVLATGGDSYSISTAHLEYGRVHDLLTDPRLVALVRDLLGEASLADREQPAPNSGACRSTRDVVAPLNECAQLRDGVHDRRWWR
jgi:hypothetical protein